MAKKIKLTSAQREVIQSRIVEYVGKQVGLARYMNSVVPSSFPISSDAKRTLDFFLKNPLEVGLKLEADDMLRIEQEDYTFCSTITDTEYQDMLYAINDKATSFRNWMELNDANSED